MALKTPEYSKQSQAFARAAEDLVTLRGARTGRCAARLLSMTLACVQCHRYVARARVATGAGSRAVEQ